MKKNNNIMRLKPLAIGLILAGLLPVPAMAPTVGEQSEQVLAEVLGYDAERIEALRATGVLGKKPDDAA